MARGRGFGAFTPCDVGADHRDKLYPLEQRRRPGRLPGDVFRIQDGDPGEGNIAEDPQFRTGALGDYYLRQTAAGQLANSPCVNAGKPDLSLVIAAGDAAFTEDETPAPTRTHRIWGTTLQRRAR